MSFALHRLPLRLTAGAFILNSGLNKLNLDAESAGGLQQMALNAFPQLEQLSAEDFGQYLAAGEITLGASLLAPFLPRKLVGLGLTAFAASLVWVYLRTPGMTEDDGIRPTQAGIGMAKDVFLLGIGLALLLEKKSATA
ncbi:DoxX family membrane protein [Ruania halotolerans]|uniref:DoxX family membrane protein n=1 Tax=Ruania halotolerans TaxID=2897773 RepID=UPI001E5FB40E|nr:DoxX family membrane protein [Ruania halotolerans]UFU05428.1 DoxX family membrane protein [Ruania halotolerans]